MVKDISAPSIPTENNINQIPPTIPIYQSDQQIYQQQQFYQQSQHEQYAVQQPLDQFHQQQDLEHAQLLSDEKICRCCQDKDPEQDLIAPCNCSGSIKWVHRKCLNKWRVVSPNPQSVYQCDICKTNYVFKEKNSNTFFSTIWLWTKFIFLVALDMGTVLFVWQLMVGLLTIPWVIAGCTTPHQDNFFEDLDNIFWGQSWLAYYICGLGTFFFLLGIVGLVLGFVMLIITISKVVRGKNPCSNEISEEYHYTMSTYPYYNYWFFDSWFFFYWYPFPLYHHHNYYCCSMNSSPCLCVGDIGSTTCSGGGGNCGDCGGDGDPKGLLIIAAVVVVFFIVVGVITGIIAMSILLYQSIRRRIVIIKRRHVSRELEIVDLSKLVQLQQQY